MKYVLLFTIFLLTHTILSAQKNVIVVIDSISSLPISFARFSSASNSFYTDVDGKVVKHKLISTTYDVISIGYNTKKVKISSTTDTIFLTPATHALNEFVISDHYDDPYEIGYHKYYSFGTRTHGRLERLLALFIPSKKNSAKIEEIILALGRVKKGFEYRVYLFGVDEKGFPSDTIFAKNVVHNSRKNVARIDVREQHIIMPTNGIVVGFNWLVNVRSPTGFKLPASAKNETHVKATRRIKKTNSFSLYKGAWRKYTVVYDEPNKPIYMNYRFGLKVKPF